MQTADVLFLQLRNRNWMDCISTYSKQSLCAKSTKNQSRFHHNLTREERKLRLTTLLYLSSVCKGEKKTSDIEGCHWNYEVPSTPDRKGRHTGAKLTLKNNNTANTPSPAIASLSMLF